MESSQDADWVAELPSEQSGDRLTRTGLRPAAVEMSMPRLSWNRLDLAISLSFLENLTGTSSAFIRRLYIAHLAAIEAEGSANASPQQPLELGQSSHGLEQTLRTFRSEDPEAAGRCATLASDGTVLTGAHEAACSLFLNRPIELVRTTHAPAIYDYRFFQNRGFDDELLDATVLRFVERAPDAYIALLWPVAKGCETDVESILAPVAYRKDVSLGPNGAHNLLTQVYAGEPWLGDPSRNYPGVRNKLVPCFGSGGPIRVFVFQSDSLNTVLAAKQAIRKLFGIGKHSIHITDTHAEAVKLARLLLNRRSIHFLNAGQPARFSSTLRLAAGFEEFLRTRNLPAQRVAVDTGMVLAAYGLREAQDVDFVTTEDVESDDIYSRHGAGAHQLSTADLLDDPEHHFHYWGLKLISLEQVARMKARRRAGRDLDDLRLIAPVLAASSRQPGLRLAASHLRFALAKGRRRLIGASKFLGLYGPLKNVRKTLLRRGS